MTEAGAAAGDCRTALLYDLGIVQSGGALVAVHADTHRIDYCSANSTALVGTGPSELLGQTGVEWFRDRWPEAVRLADEEGMLRWRHFDRGTPCILAGHRRGKYLIFEFMHAATSFIAWDSAARATFAAGVNALDTIQQCCDLLVRRVFEEGGYDRVMMYRFLQDWSGEVVQELTQPEVQGFQGLRFPASDIPPNARQLFTVNWQRMIADVDAETFPVCMRDEELAPLDLTFSALRASHPVHIQYLKNMGVRASLTVSVVVCGKLWGLIACHHLSPRSLTIGDRLTLEAMARLVSERLSRLTENLEARAKSGMLRKLAELSVYGTPADNLNTVCRAFDARGGWMRRHGQDHLFGEVPDERSRDPLMDYLESLDRNEVGHYDSLPFSLRAFPQLSTLASGLLFLPLAAKGFIALVRPALIQEVSWAGKQDSLKDVGNRIQQTLTPRNSFAIWSEIVRDTASPWSTVELAMAAQLRANPARFHLD